MNGQKALIQPKTKKPLSANSRGLAVNQNGYEDYNTSVLVKEVVTIERTYMSHPRCGYCGEPMQQDFFWRGGRGWDLAWFCKNWCHPDKYAESNIIDLPAGRGEGSI